MKRAFPRPEDIEAMAAHAERDYPHECCGVVLGKRGEPSRNEVRPCRNIQEEMRRRDPGSFQRGADAGYFMDPKDLRDAFLDAAKRGLALIGFYHSHPEHGAYWSQEDHRAAMWAGADEPSYPDAFNVVISVIDGKAKGHAVFTWDEKARRFMDNG
jgi:proteasome lid subunit RPN8/RPN11